MKENEVLQQSSLEENGKFNTEVPSFADRQRTIIEFGAVSHSMGSDISEKNAKAINAAIDTISQEGGGTVVIPAGIWFTGPIQLKSNVRLFLEKQSVLKFTKDKEQYPLLITNYEGQEAIRTVSPIMADHASNIAICGYGIIDGSGELWRPVKQVKMTQQQWQDLCKQSQYLLEGQEGDIWFPTESAMLGYRQHMHGDTVKELDKADACYDYYRPVMVSLRYCRHVLLEGVTFMNSPAWNIHPFFCEHLTVRNAIVKNPYYAQNGDGIDVESCKKVHIHHMLFETGDDAICLKSGKNAEARTFEGFCEEVHVHDCIVNEGHGGFVIGSEMSRGVRHVLVERCDFLGTDVGIRLKSALGRGGIVHDIAIKDINMVEIKKEAVIMTMKYGHNRKGDGSTEIPDKSDIPFFKDITLDAIRCIGAEVPVKIEPVAGMPETITGIQISNSWFKAVRECIYEEANVKIENTIFNVFA